MQKMDITFVTCDRLPNLDPDDLPVLELLRGRGWHCGIAVWNNPSIDWANAGVVLLRSTWDYHLHYDEFLKWAKQRRAHLINSFDLVSWNSKKLYLLNLQQKGIATVPTAVLPHAASSEQLNVAFDKLPWRDIIIKPSVGLSTYGVKRVLLDQPESRRLGLDHALHLSANNDVLVQPFLPAVDEYGERSLSFFNGQFSHAVRKSSFQKLAIAGQAGETSVIATTKEIETARKALSVLPEIPVYARVDLIPDGKGQVLLMELELIEPSLFIRFDEEASARFADVLDNLLQQRRQLVHQSQTALANRH